MMKDSRQPVHPNYKKTFYLIGWLPGLQTGRGEPMSVISDTEVRGDLILMRMTSEHFTLPPSILE